MARNFRYIIKNKLAGMEMPGYHDQPMDDLLFMLKEGIDVVVSLTEDPIPYKIHLLRKFEWIHFPIDDFGAPKPDAAFELVKKMDERIQAGKKVLVHCLAGIGRTGMILACYMIYKENLSGADALAWIRSFSSNYVQSVEQEDFLNEFEIYCKAVKR